MFGLRFRAARYRTQRHLSRLSRAGGCRKARRRNAQRSSKRSQSTNNGGVMNENLHHVIGIDLGTTYSAVSAWNKFTEQAEIIPNREDGNSPTTPSVVSLEPRLHKVIVGRAATRTLVYEI